MNRKHDRSTNENIEIKADVSIDTLLYYAFRHKYDNLDKCQSQMLTFSVDFRGQMR